MSSFGDGGPDRCSMGPKPSLEKVFYSLKSPFWRGVQRHIHGLQCRPSDCDFWLEWFGWINGTWGTYQKSRFGDGGPERCSMGPKPLFERVFFSLKSPFLRGGQRHVHGLNVTKVAGISGWNGSCGSIGPIVHGRRLDLVMGAMPGAQWVQNHRLRGSFLA